MVQFYKGPSAKNIKQKGHKRSINSKGKKETIQIDTADHSGNGLCLSSHPLTIVDKALPGELCEVHINSENKKVRFAQVAKIIKASDKRSEAFCQYYGKCGGCSLQHTSARNGLEIKNSGLKSFMDKHAGISPALWLPAIENQQGANKPISYRRRVRLAIDARRIDNTQLPMSERVKIGYRHLNSQEVIDVAACPIAEPLINKGIALLQDSIKYMPSINKVGHFVLTANDTVCQLAIFVQASLPEKSMSYLRALSLEPALEICIVEALPADELMLDDDKTSGRGKAISEQKAVSSQQHLSITTRLSAMSIPSRHDQDAQPQAVSAKSMSIDVAPRDFLQVNTQLNQKMLTTAREWVYDFLDVQGGDYKLFDFFCGSGNFSLALADLFGKVEGFEGVQTMVDTARKNATYNAQLDGVNNCEFSCLDLKDKASLKRLSIDNSAVVLLDPSREGARELCQVLLESRACMIIYVSCNPNSFARDAKILSQHYDVKKILALDMFPYTKHLELMAMFTRK